VAKVELALLEGHEACGGKKARCGLAEHLSKNKSIQFSPPNVK